MTEPAPDLRRRVAEAVDTVFEQWIDGLGGARPQDAIVDAVMVALQPDSATSVEEGQ